MSTKTSIKRIALVAVSALGFGLLSVVPAKATAGDEAVFTTSLGTITPADGSHAVGSPVTIPLKLENTAAEAADQDPLYSDFTATFQQKPINTALVDASIAANVTGQAADWATAGTDSTKVTASANKLRATYGVDAAAVAAASLAGNFVFTPDTPGLYIISIDSSDANDTDSASDQIYILVGGAALTQAASGKGNNAGTAVTGGSAVFVYHVAGGVADDTVYNVTTSGVGTLLAPGVCDTLDATLEGSDTAVRCATAGGTASGSATFLNGSTYADGVKYTFTAGPAKGNIDDGGTGEASGSFSVDAASTTAGTQTITVSSINQSTGVPTVRATVTITWGATASSAASAQYSTAWITTGATAATSATDLTADGVSCSKSVSANACANIVVTVKDSNQVALLNAPLAATITGPGVLGAIDEDGNNSASAKSGRIVATSATTTHLDVNVGSFSIYSDGSSGTATITITSGTVTLATKTVVFYGTVAKLTPTQNLKVARASAAGAELGCNDAGCTWLTAATTPAVYIEATDAEGNIVPGLTITMVTNSANVIVSGSVVEDDATAGDGPGYYNASVTSAPGGTSGASGTVVFRTLLATGAYVSTDAITFTLGGSLESMTLALDKAAYQPGEAMVVTRTAKDSAGNPVYDGVASPAVVFSKAIGGSAPVAGEFRSGTSSSSASRPTVFAPSTGGAFEARATYAVGSTGALVQLKASATVADDASTAAATAAADAALEAIDAANAATDAANLAAEAADAATVAAEEARDAADAATAAVEALATEVASLIAGLKAQITTLANTVAKIAKRVRA